MTAAGRSAWWTRDARARASRISAAGSIALWVLCGLLCGAIYTGMLRTWRCVVELSDTSSECGLRVVSDPDPCVYVYAVS